MKRENFKPNLYKMLLGKEPYKGSYKKHFFLLFVLFSFSVFSDHEEHCDLLMSWKLPVCAKTAEERTYKSNVLSQQLAESLIRKKTIPEEVTKAGKAVFNIGFQNTFREWNWHFQGGSGFFMFDNRTFFSAYHVLELFEENISHWDEVVFKDQNGDQHDLRIKGVKFVSKLLDTVVFEVEGYNGPVLKPSLEPPQEQSYVIGYPQGFQIQSVRYPFEATDIHYGAFIELFDCYYGFDFNGSSGGPLVNKEGKAEGISSATIATPLPNKCHFFVAKKLDFLSEDITTSKVYYRSFEEVRELMHIETLITIALDREGDMNAKLTLLSRGEVFLDPLKTMGEIYTSGNPLIQHLVILKAIKMRMVAVIGDTLMQELENEDPMIGALMESMNSGGDIRNLLFSIIDDFIISSEPQQLLPVTWYERGVAAYYIDEDLETACDLWDKARQTGHPFVLSDSVIIPNLDIVRCEF